MNRIAFSVPHCALRWIVAAVILACPLNAQTGRQAVSRIIVTVQKELRFLRYVPEEYDADLEKRWPLVLFLHGANERGDQIELVKRHGLPKLVEAGQTFPFVIVSPQCPVGEWWNIAALDAFVEKIASEERIDRDRIYVTGLSMGGFATWSLAIYDPGRYAAILPICSGGEVQRAWVLRDMPVWTFHGDLDQIVPIARSQQMVDAIKAAGGAPRLTIYPGYHHDAWTVTYENPDIYTWLLSYRRSQRSVAKQ